MIIAPILPGWFSIAEVAKLDGTTTQNVSLAVQTGKIPSVRVGSHHLIAERDAAAYLSRKKVSPGRPRIHRPLETLSPRPKRVRR